MWIVRGIVWIPSAAFDPFVHRRAAGKYNRCIENQSESEVSVIHKVVDYNQIEFLIRLQQCLDGWVAHCVVDQRGGGINELRPFLNGRGVFAELIAYSGFCEVFVQSLDVDLLLSFHIVLAVAEAKVADKGNLWEGRVWSSGIFIDYLIIVLHHDLVQPTPRGWLQPRSGEISGTKDRQPISWQLAGP